GSYTLTQTNAGTIGAVGACAPVYVATQYSFSFVINTAALANGPYTVTANANGYTGAFSGSGSFSVLHNQTLTVTKSGTGTGTVTGASNPAQTNINCGATCSANY